jgi:hypothetical protein
LVFAVLGLELRAFTLSASTSPFWWRVFWDRVSKTLCLGWLRTSILLTPASWVARITGVSHSCWLIELLWGWWVRKWHLSFHNTSLTFSWETGHLRTVRCPSEGDSHLQSIAPPLLGFVGPMLSEFSQL